MRVRQEAKILKNHYREMEWQVITTDDDEYDFPKSRYKPMRIWTANVRLIRACRRRYTNAAKREFRKHGDSSYFRYLNHQAHSMFIQNHAYSWWNIPND